MGISKKRRKSGRLSAFVIIRWKMLNSKAYCELRLSAAKLLPYFLGKPKINPALPEYYHIEFAFTYREAERLGFAPATFSNCLSELVGKGFIDPVWKGGLRGNGKSSNKFKLSRRWELYGKDGFIQIRWKGFAACETIQVKN